MQTHYRVSSLFYLLIIIQLLPLTAWCQVTYFYQNFDKTTSLVNPQPDTSQFSHIILTAPQLSYHKFHKGYMELTRTRQDSATGGIIRILRATPFTPQPKALLIRTNLSAESISSAAANAIYFYVGEGFDPVNNSFPGNNLMFAKFAISFTEKGLVVKDLGTQQTSDTIQVKQNVTIAWILNNGDSELEYMSPTGKSRLAPGTYDLWVGDEAVAEQSPAYPPGSAYSTSKLSNFEIRFRNGLGKIRVDEMLIKSVEPTPVLPFNVVAPNPVSGSAITINAFGIKAESVSLFSIAGKWIPIHTTVSGQSLRVEAAHALPAGIYILRYSDKNGKSHAQKVLVRTFEP